jgi:hypothetical protein
MDPDPDLDPAIVTDLQDTTKNLILNTPDPDPYLLTSGSGSGRTKNMWIRIQIRIWNTGDQLGERTLSIDIKFNAKECLEETTPDKSSLMFWSL